MTESRDNYTMPRDLVGRQIAIFFFTTYSPYSIYKSVVDILPPAILAHAKDQQINRKRNLVSKDASSNREMMAEITSNVNSK